MVLCVLKAFLGQHTASPSFDKQIELLSCTQAGMAIPNSVKPLSFEQSSIYRLQVHG